MKFYFHKFQLTPLRKLNHLSSIAPRCGVFLKRENNEGLGFCEYFPHPELGDEDVDVFLASFHEQRSNSQKKAAYLLEPKWSQVYEPKKFFNHQLYKENDSLQSHVIKYKLHHKDDFHFIKLIKKGLKLRLDANGLFDLESWPHFIRSLSTETIEHLDYIEDPMNQLNWSDITLPAAKDFIPGVPYQVNIFKPYRDFLNLDKVRTIFSGNMGNGLSNYQAYLELVEFGDLRDHHGILTDDLYQECPKLFSGNFIEGFEPNNSAIRNYFLKLESLDWTPL
jgi:hypothetical protein